MTAATLRQISGGRYVLGLGASTRALAEGFHDVPFEHPAARRRDAVTGGPRPPQRAHRAAPPRPGYTTAAAGTAACSRCAHLGRRAGPAHHPGSRRARRRLDPRAGGPRPPPRLGSPAQPGARDHCTACASPHGSGGTRHRSGPGRRHGPGPRCLLRRLVPRRHGRHLPLVGVCPGLCHAGRRHPRREPAAQPIARDCTPDAQVALDQLAAYGTGEQVRAQLQSWGHAADIVTILLPPDMPWPSIEATLRAAAPAITPQNRPARQSREMAQAAWGLSQEDTSAQIKQTEG
jgi:hypothetical protein